MELELRGITKRYPGVVANDGVSLSVRRGEIHAIVGENGAGKSTLMSILAGLYRPDAGTIAVDGLRVQFRSPRDAIERGIGMVYQHFMLVESFTVAENVLLGERESGIRLDTARVERALTALSQQYRLGIDPKARVWQLSVGERQRVEILRLLHRGARILVFDEPTAVLTPREADDLIHTLRAMAAEGFCIVFISHKLDEVLAVADRITVLRRGQTVASLTPFETTRRELARLMVGRELAAALVAASAAPLTHDAPESSAGNEVLTISGLRAMGDKGLPALSDVNLDVHEGEILGIAGVAGNGQRELAEVITGLRPASAGCILISGVDLTNRSCRQIARAGVAHVPEDRLGTGLVGSLDLAANAMLRDYRQPPLARGPFLAGRAIAAFADRLLSDYDVASTGRAAKLRDLSGGNQQKLLLARELAGQPRLIVAVHPTRGVDVGATEAIHRVLLAQRGRGAATLLISEDLDELLALCDRIAVLYEGRVMGTIAARHADREELGLLMAGGAGIPEAVPA